MKYAIETLQIELFNIRATERKLARVSHEVQCDLTKTFTPQANELEAAIKRLETAELATTGERSTEYSTANNRSDEIAFLEVIKSVLLSEVVVSENPEIRRLYENINDRIAQLRAMR